MRPERLRRLRDVLTRRQPDLTVLLDHVNKPHNFSAILRSCDAVGVLEAHAVLPEHGLELHDATSAGTRKWMRVHTHPDVGAAQRHLHSRGFRIVAAHLTEEAVEYTQLDYTRPTAFLLGAELQGVSERALRGVDALVTIPMMGMVQSLNVSVAAALLLYEARRQRAGAGLYDAPRLSEEEAGRLLFEWAYPEEAERLRSLGSPYPRLGPTGNILPPA